MSIISEKADIVEFHGASLFIVNIGGVPHVAVKPICEAIGVDWEGQHKRIKGHPVLSKGISVTEVPSQGGLQRTICLPLNKINGFLFGINANRIQNPEVREKLISYQAECFDALNAYWNKGVAVNPRQITINTEQQFQIKEAVLNAAQRTGETYQSVYRRFYNQFKIPKYQDLLAKDFDDAIAYLGGNRITFNPEIVDTVTHIDMMHISAICTHMRYLEGWWHQLQPAIRMFNKEMAHSLVHYFHEGGCIADKLLKRYGLNVVDTEYVSHYPFAAGRSAQIEYTKCYKSIHGYK